MAIIGMLSTMFIGFTLLSNFMAGQFFRQADWDIVNQLMVFRPMSVFGWFTLPVPNLTFITQGLPILMDWEKYRQTIFTGNAAMIELILYSLSAFVTFALLMAIIGVVAGRIGR